LFILSHIPDVEDVMIALGSNFIGSSVFSHTLNLNLERRKTSPTLVCSKPNRKPEITENDININMAILILIE
jgi:hypothetical protein